jgi:hypothetical protein
MSDKTFKVFMWSAGLVLWLGMLAFSFGWGCF